MIATTGLVLSIFFPAEEELHQKKPVNDLQVLNIISKTLNP
jgi:hypothetical protein